MEKVNPLIEVKNLFFSYNGVNPLIRDLNFELFSSEKIGLKGKTGSGKTTFLYLLMGFYRPLAGTIKIFGKERREEKDFIEIRPRLGLLFQDPEIQLFCPTVKEDLAFGPLNLGKSRSEVLRKIDEVSEFLGITHLLERSPLHLSGGEKKLCALASVMTMEPELYLLDEPTNGLDEIYLERLYKFIKEKVKTCIIVSHDEDFLKGTCTKIYQLKEGVFEKVWELT